MPHEPADAIETGEERARRAVYYARESLLGLSRAIHKGVVFGREVGGAIRSNLKVVANMWNIRLHY
jgi:hypothetical protein